MLFGTAVPILPGKADRVRSVAQELDVHRDEYEALNRRYEIEGHAMWINHQRDGAATTVNLYSITPQGLAAMRGRRWDTDSAYDRWWLDWVGDVYGFDLMVESSHAAAPETVFSWPR